jgi:alkyl sulfatase BDS1-like metallo-beta-lactamase superfamily hydrolase
MINTLTSRNWSFPPQNDAIYRLSHRSTRNLYHQGLSFQECHNMLKFPDVLKHGAHNWMRSMKRSTALKKTEVIIEFRCHPHCPKFFESTES